MKRCVDCKYYGPLSFYACGVDMADVAEEPAYCEVSNAGNLWTFPFAKTKCKLFEKKDGEPDEQT